MKVTADRLARYLKKQKQINNYLLKLNTSNREDIYKLIKIRYRLFEAEQLIRDLITALGEQVG